MPFVQGAFDVLVLLWLVPRLVRWQARLAAALLGREIPEPYRPVGDGLAEGRRLLASRATWRDAAWMAVHGLTGLQAALIAVAIWPAIPFTLSLPLWWWAAP